MKKKGTSILKLIDGIGNIYIYIYGCLYNSKDE